MKFIKIALLITTLFHLSAHADEAEFEKRKESILMNIDEKIACIESAENDEAIHQCEHNNNHKVQPNDQNQDSLTITRPPMERKGFGTYFNRGFKSIVNDQPYQHQ